MIPVQSALDRIEIEVQAREGERSTYWQTGRFSLRGLRYAQELIAKLPNTKSEALAALARLGKPDPDVTADMLRLTHLGWNDRPLATLHEVQRRELVDQAIARLKDHKDSRLLASAILVAKSLPDYRSVYEQCIQPLAEWAAKHTDEIEEESTV